MKHSNEKSYVAWSKIKSLLLRLTLWSCLIFVIVYASVYWWFHNSVDRVLNDTQQAWLISEMSKTPELPEKIYHTMVKYFPDFYTENSWSHKMKNVIGSKSAPCQCTDLYLPYIPGANNEITKWVPFDQHDLLVKLYIEKHFSQKDCFTFNMNISEFGRGIHGISEAAIHYYNKQLSELTEKEIVGLYVIHKAPAYYNPTHKKNNFDHAVNAIMNKPIAEF